MAKPQPSALASANGATIMELKEAKRQRLRAILEFARTEIFTSQYALTDWLVAHGHSTNQGQTSRDLEILGLSPYIDKYGDKHLGRRSKILSEQIEQRFVKVFQEAVLSADRMEKYVFIETLPGCASAVAAIIEAAGWQKEVLTVSYGWSSVTILCWSDAASDDVLDRIKEGIL